MDDLVPLEVLIRQDLNRRSAENESNTPDFLLAEYLIDCLNAWNKATKARDSFYNVHLSPGEKYFKHP